jgi:integrase
MPKGNRPGHRRFGNVRRLPSGRYQASYRGLDGLRKYAPDTFERKTDAERFLALVEVQLGSGDWANPAQAKVRLGDYARVWIAQRPGLRPRTTDLYRWLLMKHIAPYLGQVPVGKISPQLVREWRATLLASGVSSTVAAKAYRLLRAVLMTAVEEDKIIARNPCRIRGAGSEHAPERPVLTVAQVFNLAERVGRRPVGNIRGLATGGYRLRCRRDGQMRTSPEAYATRADAERALWELAEDGRADYSQDRRYRALVLLATFASLRWGEVIALRRCDVDPRMGTVRVRASFVERSNGQILLGPPKSKAGMRVFGIPKVIRPVLHEHLSLFAGPESGALVFPGAKGGPLRRGNFNKLSGWPHAVQAIGAEGLHFHDLRHTGNAFAAASGAGLRDLMARMGHDSERAAIIYQHAARGADEAIIEAMDAHVEADQADDEDGGDGAADVPVPAG